MLECVVRSLDGIIFCTVALPLSDVLYIATRINTSYNFFDCVLTCATFGFCLLGFALIRLISNQFLCGGVRRETTIVGTRTAVEALAI